MDLTQFSQTMFQSPQEANNYFSIMIGLYPENKYAQPILHLYLDLPETLKDKDIFQATMLKYFQTYKINTHNYSTYELFSQNWSENMKKEITNTNADFFSMNPQVEYKNSLSFAKAVYTQFRQYDSETSRFKSGFPFLEENRETLSKLMKKNKIKLIENFEKEQVWGQMMQESYIQFKAFCHDYGFDAREIFRRYAFESSRDLTFLTTRLNLNHEIMKEVMKDLIEDKAYLENTYFLKGYEKTQGYLIRLNVVDTALTFLNDGLEAEAGLLLAAFESAASQYLKQVFPKRDNFFLYENEMWHEYIEKVKLNEGRSNSNFALQTHHINNLFSHQKEIGKILEFASLRESLEQKLEVKTTARKLKI